MISLNVEELQLKVKTAFPDLLVKVCRDFRLCMVFTGIVM